MTETELNYLGLALCVEKRKVNRQPASAEIKGKSLRLNTEGLTFLI